MASAWNGLCPISAPGSCDVYEYSFYPFAVCNILLSDQHRRIFLLSVSPEKPDPADPFGAVGVGAVVHLFAIVLQSAALGGLPIYTLGQSLSMAGLSLAAMFIYTQYRFRLKILGVYAAAMISVLMIASIFLPEAAKTRTRYTRAFLFGILYSFSVERPCLPWPAVQASFI